MALNAEEKEQFRRRLQKIQEIMRVLREVEENGMVGRRLIEESRTKIDALYLELREILEKARSRRQG
jgi:hypothetical protein